jgi:hypothetical protein
LVAVRASCIPAPEAITAQTIAPAEEPANGVVSCSEHKKNNLQMEREKRKKERKKQRLKLKIRIIDPQFD